MLQKLLLISTLSVLMLGITQACGINVNLANTNSSVNSPNPQTNSQTKKNTSATTLEKIELPANFQYPNGITQAKDGTLYIGSITSGKILRIKPGQQTEIFFPGNNQVFAANTLRLDQERGIIWGTSSDFLGVRGSDGQVTRRSHRIFAIDINSGEVIRVIVMPDGGFGNDIALDEKGGVYITDSWRSRIHYLADVKNQLQIWVQDQRFAAADGQVGLAGIARHKNGVIIVGHFSQGKLFQVTPQASGKPKVEEINLSRTIENPDGMQFTADGQLIIIEGAIKSGNGRLLQIEMNSSISNIKEVKEIASQIISPVNLTLSENQVWVTESRIRHRLFKEEEANIPKQFFIHRFQLLHQK
ncbi:gluconolaconase [Plectonema cf. radiosum LEGE 06105]|uniref:Gluconolaconase n=1 Tax=Plectonema cf. radiosum LEGE 06105 TaxID=945769 RepID=A0A8J7JRM7_9CYAN|nr:gluconolaconase [Plectonema radiosum]MBE9211514.1 gluconolaconase [Plectonema cf. radiosum LEGE 06105]